MTDPPPDIAAPAGSESPPSVVAEVYEAPAHDARRPSKTLPSPGLPHLLKPTQWGLRLRILLVAGLLLALGMVSLVGFESWQLNSFHGARHPGAPEAPGPLGA